MRKKIIVTLLMIISVCSTGCGALVDMPELSEEESEIVTEYAAGLMLKYDDKFVTSLLSEDELAKEKAKEEDMWAKEKAYKEAAANYKFKTPGAKDDAADTDTNVESEVVQTPSLDNIASFYGIDGISVDYAGYDILDSYPEAGGDMFMAMDATPGHNLLVVKFNVINNSSDTVNFDMFYRSPNFAVSLDGGKSIHQQATLLLDDLAAYVGDIESGSSVPMVLIFEIDDSIQSVGSLTLTAKSESGKGTMVLQ